MKENLIQRFTSTLPVVQKPVSFCAGSINVGRGKDNKLEGSESCKGAVTHAFFTCNLHRKKTNFKLQTYFVACDNPSRN